MKKESAFQREIIESIKERFPGCKVLKTDANHIQGFPDLLILYEDRWAALETKREACSKHRPNQDYYVTELNRMSYSSFVYPENKEKVLNDLQQALRSERTTRISKSE